MSGEKPTPRFVVLATSAAPKVAEYDRHFARYGIVVKQAASSTFFDYAALAAAFADPKCFAVIRDQAQLLKGLTPAPEGKEVEADVGTMQLARSVVTLEARLRSGATSKFTAVSTGVIDPSLRAGGAAADDVYGYDDVFVSLESGESFQSRKHSATTGKISSRDTVISQFIRQNIYYAARLDLAHASDLTKPTTTIDFAIDPASFVSKHKLLGLGLEVPGYGNVLRDVINSGLFFRSPLNRREKNYWWPGLNAGLPLTAKRDAVHEATFMAHDFGHFLIPDLIFTGSDLSKSPLGQSLYIIFRMMSEAVTMVLADILYVEGLRTIHKVEYDWTARKIHPLLVAAEAHTGQKLLTPRAADAGAAAGSRAVASDWVLNDAFLKAMLRANVDFCIKGDESGWRALIGTTDTAAAVFSTYQRKYAPFFVADYSWTAHNIEGMATEADTFKAWWAQSSSLTELGIADSVFTVDSFADVLIGRLPATAAAAATGGAGAAGGASTASVASSSLSAMAPAALVDLIFDTVWERSLAPALTSSRTSSFDSRPLRFLRAFVRYSLGQHALFARHTSSVGESVRHALVGQLKACAARGGITDAEVADARAVYGAFVDSLTARLEITADDATVSKEVHALFEPYFVTYDADPESYASLPAVFARIIKL